MQLSGAFWGQIDAAVRPQSSRFLLATGRRDDAVHPQVFHQLSVMVETMTHGSNCERETVSRALSEGIFYGGDHVLLVDGLSRFLNISEGILQVIDDVGFALDRIRTVFSTGIDRRLLSQD